MKQKFWLLFTATLLTTAVFIACKKNSNSTSTTATISALTCASTTFSATSTINVAYSSTASVPYTGGNGIAYTAGTAISSTGVTGLTATLAAGTLASGAGNLSYTVSGTPTSSGTASFAITFGGQSCTMALIVNAAGSTTATITALTCASATFSNTSTINVVYSGTASVPYTGGNGIAYTAGTAIASTGVTGLTATLAAGTLASGAGNLTYNITGTPTSTGTASFALSFGGQTCTMALIVNAASGGSCSSATGIAKVICLCDAFKATLSSTQIATAYISYNFTNAKKWSNLPAAMSARNGIKFGDLSSTQLAAAKALIQAITGTTTNEGYSEVQQVWAADDWLVSNGGANSDYGSGNYYLAILGTPATTGTFEILETGHHKTVANTYVNGVLVGATPEFSAVEPISWTNGSTYAPISQERDAFVTFLASLTSTQLATAKTSATYSDLVLVPGQEWTFPTTFSGLQGSALTTAQKTNLLNVIKTYTGDVDDTNAASILTTYTNELDNTYVLYSGTTAMTTKFDYFQISGPHVWIEFIVAGGIVYQNQTHIHSIWRDRIKDYGGTH